MGSSVKRFALHYVHRDGLCLSRLFPSLLEVTDYEQHRGTYGQSASKPKPSEHRPTHPSGARVDGTVHQKCFSAYLFQRTYRRKKITENISELLHRLIKQYHVRRKE